MPEETLRILQAMLTGSTLCGGWLTSRIFMVVKIAQIGVIAEPARAEPARLRQLDLTVL